MIKLFRNRWNPWPVSITAFFIVAIASCVAFVAFCGGLRSDLVSSDYYERELQYQAHMDREQRARRLEHPVSITYDAHSNAIRVAFPAQELPADIHGEIHLYRPSAADLDKRLKLRLDSTGAQNLDAAQLQPGLWRVRVSWTAARQDYFAEQRLVLGSKQP